MINEDYCSYEVAKLLEDNGFPIGEHLLMYVNKDGKLMTDHQACLTMTNDEYRKFFDNYIPTVTQALAMKWLREKHNIHISANPIVDYVEDADGRKYMENVYWAFDFMNSESGEFIETPNNDYQFGTYEEAVEAALKYSLENLI